MIITLKGADFSASNIGTLSTWRITRSLGSGATYEGVTSVDKGASFTGTVTIAEGYELGTAGVTVTMGGVALSNVATIVDNVITISIAEVTGNVVIKVPTVNTTTGGDSGDDSGNTDTPVTGGDGTASNPYMISTAADLVALGTEVDAGDSKSGVYYALANDIDLADYAWDPIGANLSDSNGGTVVGFAGTFDGQGHVIKNLTINSTDIQYAGLFGGYFDGVLMNLGLEGGSINTTKASSTVGALARKMVSTTSDTTSNARIVNCYSRVPCTAVTRSAGLVDSIEDGGILAGCYQAAAINNGSGYAIRSENVASGDIHYCMWDNTLTSKGVANAKNASNNNGLTTEAFATAASTLNANMNAVATMAGINVTKLCTWEDGPDGYPVLVPGSYGSSDSSGNEGTETPTAYTLTISKGTGVESVTVTKTSGYGTTGTLTSGATIYAGDVLSVSATASSGYTLDSYTSSITVSDNVTINVTATADTPTGMTGSGTKADPYMISTAAHLTTLGEEVDAGDTKEGTYYALADDIDLTGVEWNPIGSKVSGDDLGFEGVFDGRGHVIRNINIGATDNQYAGLFGSCFDGTLMNLGMEGGNIDITGSSNTQATCGALMRKACSISNSRTGNARIVNCYSRVPVTGVYRSSGLVDDIADGSIVAGCYQAATVTPAGQGAYALHGAQFVAEGEAFGALHYCLWDSTLTTNGYNEIKEVTNTVGLTTEEFATAAATMNTNLAAVAEISGISASELCSWQDGPDGYPVMIPGYYGGQLAPLGSESNPYLISTAADFKALADTVDAGTDTTDQYYAITNDLDLSEYTTWDPIGAKDKTSADKDTGFKGTLDGRGHIISGANVTGVQYAGLFGTNMTGTIMNLGIEDSTFSSSGVSSGTTGSFCRKITAASGKIINCYSLANVAGQTRAGGLVDDIVNGIVAGCYYAGTATSDTANANYALTSGGSSSNGTLAYCLWDSDLSYTNGYNTTATSLTRTACEGKAEITADDMNDNLNAVATLAGIDVAKLCAWEDREGGYPRLVVKSA